MLSVKLATNGFEPERLLPRVNKNGLRKKAKALGLKNGSMAARIDVLVDCWSQTRIGLKLCIHEVDLFRLGFELAEELTFFTSSGLNGERSAEIRQALWDPQSSRATNRKEKSTVFDQETVEVSVYEYSGLRPFCLITDFYLHQSERAKGLGKAWYLEIVEPFLRRSAVNVAVCKGSCLETTADIFWRKMGFDRIIPYHYEWDTDIMHSFRFKLLAEIYSCFA
jgi:hypothetical protein